MRILVVGASGYIGSHLVPLLAARGHTVRAAARDRERLESNRWAEVECVAADVQRPATLEAALAGIEVAYYLVHSMGSGHDFARLDRQGARNFRRAAERAGVSRIIYLGGLQPPDSPSAHLESRAETGEILRDGPIPVTEIRAGIIVGAGSAAFEVIRDLALHLPVMVTPRWVRSRTQPIALDDLLGYLVGLIECAETAGHTYDVAAPETLTYSDMLQQFAALNGKHIRVFPVPVLTPRLSSYWLDLVTAVPANVARPLIDGLRHDLLADDAPIRRLISVPLHTTRRQCAPRRNESARRSRPPAGPRGRSPTAPRGRRWRTTRDGWPPPPRRMRRLLRAGPR